MTLDELHGYHPDDCRPDPEHDAALTEKSIGYLRKSTGPFSKAVCMRLVDERDRLRDELAIYRRIDDDCNAFNDADWPSCKRATTRLMVSLRSGELGATIGADLHTVLGCLEDSMNSAIQYRHRIVELEKDLAAVAAERDRWKLQSFRPLGDNHHNALLCPHCQERAAALSE